MQSRLGLALGLWVISGGEQRVLADIDERLATFSYRDGHHPRVVHEDGRPIFLHAPPSQPVKAKVEFTQWPR